MAVSQIVDSNDLDTRRLAPELHAALQGVLGQGEDAAVRFQSVKLLKIVLHLVTEKVWNWNLSFTLSRFGSCDDILALKSLVSLVDINKLVRR